MKKSAKRIKESRAHSSERFHIVENATDTFMDEYGVVYEDMKPDAVQELEKELKTINPLEHECIDSLLTELKKTIKEDTQ